MTLFEFCLSDLMPSIGFNSWLAGQWINSTEIGGESNYTAQNIPPIIRTPPEVANRLGNDFELAVANMPRLWGSDYGTFSGVPDLPVNLRSGYWLNTLAQLRAGEDHPAIHAVPLHRFLCSAAIGQQVWPTQPHRLLLLWREYAWDQLQLFAARQPQWPVPFIATFWEGLADPRADH